MIDELCAIDLKTGVLSLVSIIPNIRDYIAPTLNITFLLQSNIGNLNMKKTSVTDEGMWQNSICVNAQISILHTENDCTYTVIATPYQKDKSIPIFIIELQKGYTI